MNTVNDKLQNLNHFASRFRNVHITFNIAVIIAVIPKKNHLANPPTNVNTNKKMTETIKTPVSTERRIITCFFLLFSISLLAYSIISSTIFSLFSLLF